MKKLVILVLLLIPLNTYADKYDDMSQGLRDIAGALSQVSIQGRDAAIFAQVQQALVQMSKDISALQKEYKTAVDDLNSSKESKKK